ncbi:MAG: PAS domain S-box protein [Deltaproteobacteria bacterium]|jgi:PAS domain S-box-containing protein|nr:PAS domain S-box protein [Deltaproteobacteria bacterium]
MGISVARDGITLYANPSCARLFGYDHPGELVGTSQLGRVAPESRRQVTDCIERRRRGEPAPLGYEIVGLRKDGTTFPLCVEVNLIDSGGCPLSMAYFTDLTERKRAESALLDSGKRFRNLVESIDEFLADNDTNGICRYASPRVFDLLGYQPHEVVGRTPFDLMPNDEANRLREIFRRASGLGEPLHSFEYAMLHKSGRLVFLETSATPYFDGAGRLEGYRSITRDVTARREAAEALRRAREELEARVRERTEELASLNEKLLKDIEERQRIEETLRQRELELKQRNIKLEEMNVTLNTILEQRDRDRKILEQRVSANINELLKPLLEKLAQCRTGTQRQSCLEIIESSLDEVVSPFSQQLTDHSFRLTPTEIQIANCICKGMRSKEIASLLRLSKGTIDFHRNNIRRKLGLNRRKTSLRSHLLSLSMKI